MPKYRCFKEVRALKIFKVEAAGCDTTTDENPIVKVSFDNPRFASQKFNLRGKPTPEAGWWYILYEDGYSSFSPAKAFEEGYMPVELIPKEPVTLQDRIARQLNALSLENGSNTPDFILAAYLQDCLAVFDKTINVRELWYGRNPAAPAAPPAAPPEEPPYSL